MSTDELTTRRQLNRIESVQPFDLCSLKIGRDWIRLSDASCKLRVEDISWPR